MFKVSHFLATLFLFLSGAFMTFYVVDIRQGFKRTATVAFKKHDGTPGEVEGIPVWESSDTAVIAVQASEDGMSAELVAMGEGTAVITATADGDLGAGVVPVVVQETFAGLLPLGAESAVFTVSEPVAV